MLVTHARRLGRELGINGVWGNLGAAMASGMTALLSASLGWRAAFVVPGLVCLAVGAAFLLLVPHEGDREGQPGGATSAIPVARPVILLLPFYMLCVGLLSVGIGWITAGLQVYVRDTAQVVTVVLTLWFWITPIFVYEEQYPETMKFLLKWNPLALFVRAYRDRILTSRLPSWEEASGVLLFSFGAFIVGGLFFRQLKRGFADVL